MKAFADQDRFRGTIQKEKTGTAVKDNGQANATKGKPWLFFRTDRIFTFY